MKKHSLWHNRTKEAREDGDFFPTDVEITQAFIKAEGPILRRMGVKKIWEPACGDGAIAKILVEHGFEVEATDIIDRGYGAGGRDFLKEKVARAKSGITNPPYKDALAQRFLGQARRLGLEYFAMLLKANFWNPQGNACLWESLRPARGYFVAWRPDFLGLGGGMLDVNWWVWDFRRRQRETKMQLLTIDGRCL